MFSHARFLLMALWAAATVLVVCDAAMAYVGPGAGMEFIGYAAGLIAMVVAAFFSILMWPVYTVLRWWRGPKPVAETPQPDAPPTDAPADSASQAPTAPTTP